MLEESVGLANELGYKLKENMPPEDYLPIVIEMLKELKQLRSEKKCQCG